MAVSKRLRFEVFRRDNHSCTYCGQSAPAVKLTVDHVVPTTLGGTDVPSNLVAACVDCNAGKSSVPAGAPLVESVRADALRWSQAMDAVMAERVEAIEAKHAYLNAFLELWQRWTYGASDKPVPLAADWQRSLASWYELGIPLIILEDAITLAMTKKALRGGEDARYPYMASIIWNIRDEIEQRASLASREESEPRSDSHCAANPWCFAHESDDVPCPRCGETDCLWHCGYGEGHQDGREHNRLEHHYEIAVYRCLTAVTDGPAREV